MPTNLPIDAITADESVQSRAELHMPTVEDYTHLLKDNVILPPIDVVFDQAIDTYWVADGHHRYWATVRAERKQIACNIIHGTKRDAILHSVGSNHAHGLRRNFEDKRRSVRMLLTDEEWKYWSNSEIARRCGVSHTFVAKSREILTCNVSSENSENQERTYKDKHGNTSTMKTGNIGKAKADAKGASLSTVESDNSESAPVPTEPPKLETLPEIQKPAHIETEAQQLVEIEADELCELLALIRKNLTPDKQQALAFELLSAPDQKLVEENRILAEQMALVREENAGLLSDLAAVQEEVAHLERQGFHHQVQGNFEAEARQLRARVAEQQATIEDLTARLKRSEESIDGIQDLNLGTLQKLASEIETLEQELATAKETNQRLSVALAECNASCVRDAHARTPFTSSSDTFNHEKPVSGGVEKGVKGKKQTAKSKTRDPRTDHPAIQAIYQLTGRYPNSELYDRMIAALGSSPNMQLLKRCREDWLIRGYSTTATVWAEEWYPQGGPPARTTAPAAPVKSMAEFKAQGRKENLNESPSGSQNEFAGFGFDPNSFKPVVGG